MDVSASHAVAPALRASSGYTQVEPEAQLGIPWLIRLRWGAVIGQFATLVAVQFAFATHMPYEVLFALVGLTAASNAAMPRLARRISPELLVPVVLVLDVVVLTGMLAVSGGPANPFTAFYMVHVALAALMLARWLAWFVVMLTIAAFASLFFWASMPHAMHNHSTGGWSTHLLGMWGAHALAAGFVAYFVGRVSREIRARDRRIAEIAGLAAQNERLASLSSFAANAAHELGTPLATIGLAADELALAITREPCPVAVHNDVTLVRDEVARCRAILADLSARSGESMGEMPLHTTPTQLVELLTQHMSPRLRNEVAIAYDEGAATANVVVPPRTLAQVVHNLVRNAVEAQDEVEQYAPVRLEINVAQALRFRIYDQGPGLSPEVQARVGEPFVTTKASLGGLGLGIYLARAFAERTGGTLRFESRPTGGLCVELSVPRDMIRGETP